MCGRYASSRKPEDLVEEFEISAPGANKVEEALAPDYNVAPTKPVYAVVERSPSSRDDPDPE
ncbi:MAG TPA: SOS response-associated peptidase family protein, partial [Nocardioides sp.]|nr:SOS response-associated peptidase family protein [Nocardioides sp.]